MVVAAVAVVAVKVEKAEAKTVAVTAKEKSNINPLK
jgi:hypothetical protein